MTTALFLFFVAIAVAIYLGVETILGYGASRFDDSSPLERSDRS